MFPYYWNGSNSTMPFGATFAGLASKDLNLHDLPDEVLESLELHKDALHSEQDVKNFLDELDLKK